MQICRICGKKKELKEFRKNYPDACLSCTTTSLYKSQLKSKYGLAARDFDCMLQSQKNQCKICGTDFSTLPYNDRHVDHCHGTGVVRGILCRRCNLGLGNFQDSSERMKNAILYLEGTLNA